MTFAQTWEVGYGRGEALAGLPPGPALSSQVLAGPAVAAAPLTSPDLAARQPASSDCPLSSAPGAAHRRPVPLTAEGYCQVLLALGPESAKAARDFTTTTLRNWKLDEVISEAVLIASELVTNAIRHGTCQRAARTAASPVAGRSSGEAVTDSTGSIDGVPRHSGDRAPGGAVDGVETGRVELAWRRQASRLVCVVTDRSARPPVLAPADMNAESGRGLQIVQALATSWGWMMLGAREKAVWAALLLPG